MEESALKFEESFSSSETATAVEAPPILKVVPYPSPVSEPLPPLVQQPSKNHRRHQKLIRFIKIEAVSLFFLVLTLAGATTDPLWKLGVAWICEIAMVLSALVVAIIPVIFYGSTRQRYRYRSGRYRD